MSYTYTPTDDSGNPLLTGAAAPRALWTPTGYDLMIFRTILRPVVEEGRSDTATWPTWDYVTRTLARDSRFEKRSPAELIAAWPRVQDGTRQGYGYTWRTEPGAGAFRPAERIGLSIAGLKVADPLRVDAVVRLAASYADDESILPLSPTGTAEGTADFVRAGWMLARVPPADSHGGGPLSIEAAGEVLLHESPSLIVQNGPGRWSARLGPTNYEALAGVTTAREYLNRLWNRIAPLNKELAEHMAIMQSHQQSVVIVHAPGTPDETRRPVRAHIQAEKGYFDVSTQIYEGDVVEVDDPRGFTDRRGVQTLKMNHVPGSTLSHIAVTWGPAPSTTRAVRRTASSEQKIFLVHGQDGEAKETIARFIGRAAKDPDVVVILHERPNGGRTLIEKFEDHAGASSYAVVLLTPDDTGKPASDDGPGHGRARQNVIFELGYFAGLLGRDRVMVINAGVEKPSDIDGLAWISYPGGNWQSDVVRDLRHAGFDVQVP